MSRKVRLLKQIQICFKWNVTFDGQSCPFLFLESIAERASAFRVSDSVLLDSAFAFFKGDALIWYRSAKSEATSWQELADLLLKEFSPIDYEDNLHIIYTANFDVTLTALKKKVGRVQQSSTTMLPSTSEPSTSTTLVSTNTTSIWEQFDREVSKLTPTHPLAAGIVELDKYLQEPFLPRCNDPLRWWHERRTFYPILYKYVQKRLHLVATSVPCERVFSKARPVRY
ncbi:hypothetical protein B5X24_HaOG215369 [Helicoverpa armigera]|nr:hypothetical protein B5X24_HaOG215369 [Helicoverpa armigera]